MASQTVSPFEIRYRRVRVPREDGATLQLPPLCQFRSLWQSNLARKANQRSLAIDGLPPTISNLGQWQTLARQEARTLAFQHSAQYLNEEAIAQLQQRSQDSFIFAGHQPELYHPGVWFKNFVLSRLADDVKATPINLVVDSDLSTKSSVSVPETQASKIAYSSIPFDVPSIALPFQDRLLASRETFNAFPALASSAMRDYNGSSSILAEPLWREIRSAFEAISRNGTHAVPLGIAIAAGRHRLEAEHGLLTLELPISRLASTKSFAIFFEQIATRIEDFQEHHNEVLMNYRKVHRIRSVAHPVPALRRDDRWYEMPFWIWSSASTTRKPLFIANDGGTFKLSNRQDIELHLDKPNLIQQLLALDNAGIAIRTRALTTTMFSRLLLSDVFLHGIGGAKYDQLTDAIAARFFSAQLPDYITLSATCQLPSDQVITRPIDVTAIKNQRRTLKFHPETLIDNPKPEVAALIAEKRDWFSGENKDIRSKQKHEAIEAINQQLRTFVDISDWELAETENFAREKLREGQIVSSRDFSFCLFEESLIERLKHMATK